MAKIDSGLGWKVDEEFYIYEADTLIDEDDYGRKKYDGAAIIAVVFEGENTQGRPVMISTIENNCLNTQAMTAYSSTVGGVTWYGTRQNTLLRENEIIVGAKVTVAEGINPYYFPDDADTRAAIISAIITQAGVEYTPKVTTTDYVKDYVEGVVSGNNTLILDVVNDMLTDDTAYPSSAMVIIPDCKVPSNAAVSVEFEPVQDGTGDPSPENIRPISGRNIISITRCGRNLFDERMELGDISGATGENTPSNYYLRSGYQRVYALKTYYLRTPSTIRKWVYCYDENKQYLGLDTFIAGNTNTTFNIPQKTYYIRFLLSVEAYGTSTYNNDVCLNISDVTFDGHYEPYNATDYTLSLNGTRYGGRVDISDTGEAVLTVDGGYIASYNGETIGEPWMSDRDVYSAGTTPTTGAEVVYTLDTPLVYQLANCPIQLLTGINNLYSDASNISATANSITSAIGALTERVNEITLYPAPPTTDGTYTLQVTVSSGVPTYSWVAGNRSVPAVNEPDEELKKSEDSGDISEEKEIAEEKELDVSEKDVSEPAEKDEEIPVEIIENKIDENSEIKNDGKAKTETDLENW